MRYNTLFTYCFKADSLNTKREGRSYHRSSQNGTDTTDEPKNTMPATLCKRCGVLLGVTNHNPIAKTADKSANQTVIVANDCNGNNFFMMLCPCANNLSLKPIRNIGDMEFIKSAAIV